MYSDKKRVILHSDMNNFYATVECMLEPRLRNKNVVVGGSVDERHGIVLAKNYGAKACGVKTGDVIWQARQKCPDLIVVPPHYEQYLKFSQLAREIYSRYTDQIEPYGMDECWLDVTKSQLFGTGYEIAEKIRKTITFELGLTVSIGVSFNKIFAKLGSDMKKPDAITCIGSDDFKDIIWELPVEELLGVGRATLKVLHSISVFTIRQLAHTSDTIMHHKLGKNGMLLKYYANGLDSSIVCHKDFVSPVKSIGHGITTMQDLENSAEVWRVLLELVQDVANKLRIHKKKATGVSVAIKNNQLYRQQYQCKLDFPTQNASFIAEKSFALFTKNYDWEYDVRSVSITAITLEDENIPIQHDLFTDIDTLVKREKLDIATTSIRKRFGKHAIRNAVLLQDNKIVKDTESIITMPTGMIK